MLRTVCEIQTAYWEASHTVVEWITEDDDFWLSFKVEVPEPLQAGVGGPYFTRPYPGDPLYLKEFNLVEYLDLLDALEFRR